MEGVGTEAGSVAETCVIVGVGVLTFIWAGTETELTACVEAVCVGMDCNTEPLGRVCVGTTSGITDDT